MFKKIGVLSIFLSSVAYAGADLSVFGVQMGEVLTHPECKRMSNYSYDFLNEDGFCWRHGNAYGELPKEAPIKGEVEFRFGAKESPDFVDGYKFMGVLLDGAVEEVQIKTKGNLYQQDVLNVLTKKYGKPTRLATEMLTNSYGVKVDSVNAHWKLTGLHITFWGVLGSADSGMLIFQTDKAKKHEQEIENQKAKNTRSL